MPPENILWSGSLWGLSPFLPPSSRYFDPLSDTYTDNSSVPLLADLIEGLDDGETATFLSVGTLTPLAKMFDILDAGRVESVLNRVDRLVLMVGVSWVVVLPLQTFHGKYHPCTSIWLEKIL